MANFICEVCGSPKGRPHRFNCPLKRKIGFKRTKDDDSIGHAYYTSDGRFRVWKEPYDLKYWYINEIIEGEWDSALSLSGYSTLWEARQAIGDQYEREE